LSVFAPNPDAVSRDMLKALGLADAGGLFAGIPESIRLNRLLNLPAGKTEADTLDEIGAMANRNAVFKTVFRGAGAYRHHIPSVVKRIASKEEFVTAYTPYQAELSQGLLQCIFEFQTMICELTGMDASNASVYDGAVAAAEAAAMCAEKNRTKIVVSETAHPHAIETMRAYGAASGMNVAVAPRKGGVTDISSLRQIADADTACIYIQQPNFFGQLEDAKKIGEAARELGVKFVMGVNPIALAVLAPPGECGADIAVGEGQPLGIPMSFGGPYLGFMAATSAMMRKLPGRIVGETVDGEGRRAFVLTLQAREQHIRREKASSNICSNQALCAMTAAVYMAAMGPDGIKEAAMQSRAKAHYLAQELTKIPGFELKFGGEFFHEFVTAAPPDSCEMFDRLEANGILGGLPIEDGILWCATEMNSKEDIDRMVKILKEVNPNETAV